MKRESKQRENDLAPTLLGYQLVSIARMRLHFAVNKADGKMI